MTHTAITLGPDAIAAIEGASGDAAQALLEQAAARWRKAGIRVVGLVVEPHGLPDRTCTAGHLRDIVSGTRHSIFLETPPRDTSATSMRLARRRRVQR